MQQARLVGRVHGFGDLFDDAHRACGSQRPLAEYSLQIAPLDETHIDVKLAFDFAVVMDRNDVRVVQPCGGVGLPTESPLKFFIVGKMRG